MNNQQMVSFCKEFVSLLPEPRKTKTHIELHRIVVNGQSTNPASWFNDNTIATLFKNCHVTQLVYKFVRDNQNLFVKENLYTIGFNNLIFDVLSSEDPSELAWNEKIYASDEDYYANPDCIPLYTIRRFRKWNIRSLNHNMVKEFFYDDTPLKNNFIVFKDGKKIADISGAMITEQYGENSIVFTVDHIDT